MVSWLTSQAAEDGLLGRDNPVVRLAGALPARLISVLALPFGFFVGAYTGVLIGATSVPMWARNVVLMGPTFLLRHSPPGSRPSRSSCTSAAGVRGGRSKPSACRAGGDRRRGRPHCRVPDPDGQVGQAALSKKLAPLFWAARSWVASLLPWRSSPVARAARGGSWLPPGVARRARFPLRDDRGREALRQGPASDLQLRQEREPSGHR